MKKLINLYNKIVPFKFRWHIWNFKQNRERAKLKKKILTYFKYNYNEAKKYTKEIDFLNKNDLQVLPYKFISDFKPIIDVYYDKSIDLSYVLFEGKKMYFKRKMNKIEIQYYYQGLLKEQHELSPHKYLSNSFDTKPDSIIVDVGVAEGIFSLSKIEDAKFIYMFEPDQEWLEAVKYTFSPWKSKIKIITKFISNKTDSNSLTLDDFFFVNNIDFDFLKVDVDGAELELLNGASNILNSKKDIKIAICTYHNQQDELLFLDLLANKNFECETTPGFMLFHYDKNFNPPFFRRGLLRAKRKI